MKAREGKDAYFVQIGGSNAVATHAYVDAARELDAQVRAGQMPDPDIIVVTVGSGGTAAGIAAGLELTGMRARVVGVLVAEPPRLIAWHARWLAKRALRDLDCRDTGAIAARLTLDARYLGEGYGHPTPAGARAMAIAKDAGITLDPTYTAKTFAAALDLVEEGEKATILYWHTLSSAPMTPLLAGAPDEDALDPRLRGLLVMRALVMRALARAGRVGMLATFLVPRAAAAPRLVVLDDGEKIARDQERPLPKGPWPGEVQLFAMRGETVAVQAVVEADTHIEGVHATMGAFVDSGGARITPQIEVWAEHFVDIVRASGNDREPGSLAFTASSAPPADAYTGFFADALLPFEADAEAGKRAALWIDITVPSDAPPGMLHDGDQRQRRARRDRRAPFEPPCDQPASAVRRREDDGLLRGRHPRKANGGHPGRARPTARPSRQSPQRDSRRARGRDGPRRRGAFRRALHERARLQRPGRGDRRRHLRDRRVRIHGRPQRAAPTAIPLPAMLCGRDCQWLRWPARRMLPASAAVRSLSLGLRDLIAETVEEYCEIATRLAQDNDRLAELSRHFAGTDVQFGDRRSKAVHAQPGSGVPANLVRLVRASVGEIDTNHTLELNSKRYGHRRGSAGYR